MLRHLPRSPLAIVLGQVLLAGVADSGAEPTGLRQYRPLRTRQSQYSGKSMKLNRWATRLAASAACSFFAFAVAGVADVSPSPHKSPLTVGAEHAARVHARAGSQSSNLPDEIFANGFDATQATCVPGQDLDNDGLLDINCISLLPVPDPVTVAPPIDPTVVTDFGNGYGFLYTGTDPVQRGADPTKLDSARLAVLRGRVLDENELPLAGAIVRVLYGTESGYTLSRADGWYDIAVNGGGTVVLDFQMAGRIRAQRTLQAAPWRDFARVDDVALVPYDTAITTVTIGPNQDSQLARASVVSDTDGSRQATVYFPPGMDAYLYDPRTGTSTIADTLHIRATEFTVGTSGPRRMPASLPATSAYTYAMELSADEVASGTLAALNFSRPVSFYTENFLNLPVGLGVPIGYYDPSLGQWAALDNGRVIQILGVESGLAQIDIEGQGVAASTTELAALGFDSSELQRIAGVYPAGTQLMRFQMTHFSTYDLNLPYTTPPDATAPPDDEPDVDKDDEDCPCESGSIIESTNSELGERIPIAGTPYFLSYRSDSSPGRTAAYKVSVAATHSAIPASLQNVQVEWTVAGVTHNSTLPSTSDQSTAMTWDGRDVYGRILIGPRPMRMRVGYTYNGFYAAPAQIGQTFGQWSASGASLTANRTRQQVTVWRDRSVNVGTVDARARGLGGWAISAQHLYDAVSGNVWQGDGTRRNSNSVYPSINAVAGQRWAYGFEGDGIPAKDALFERIDGMATMPDGSLLIADWLSATVSRIDRNGILTRFLGNGQGCEQVPCVPSPVDAKSTTAGAPAFVTVGADGCGYVGSFVDYSPFTAEIIRVCNGQAVTVFYAQNTVLRALAAGPDGMIYVAASGSDGYFDTILRINPWSGDPTASQVVASNNCRDGYSGDGGNINAACFNPIALAVAKDGSIYFLDDHDAVRRIAPNGIVTRIAGRPLPECANPTNWCYDHTGDGGPALDAKVGFDDRVRGGNSPQIAIGEDGSIYFTSNDYWADNTVRAIDPQGIIRTVAGYPGTGFDSCDDNTAWTREACMFGAPATTYAVYAPTGIAVARDGSLYVGTGSNAGLIYSVPHRDARQVSGGTYIASRSGSELFEFDSLGRHLRTMNALTGTTSMQLGYTSGLLASIADAFGNTTTITRDGSGNITITAPNGQATTLNVDATGLAQNVIGPTGDTYALGYTSGLLTTFQRPNGPGYASTITYTTDGRLASDANAAGGGWTLTPTGPASARTVTLQSAMGRTTTHTRAELPAGGRSFSTTSPDGAISARAITPDGVEVSTGADGMQVTLTKLPDPRFGMSAPIIDQTVTTPSGLAFVSHTQRTVNLANSTDPLSLTSINQTTTINGRSYIAAFDAAAQTWTMTSPAGRTHVLTINAQNQPVRAAVPGLATVDYGYDTRGRLNDVAVSAAQNPRETQLSYDAHGFVNAVQDPLTRLTTLDNDAVGRTQTQTLPDLRQIGFAYDANSNVTGITPPGRPQHTFAYNAVDRLSTYTPPAVSGVSAPQTGYAYNLDQQSKLVTRPDGLSVTPVYNSVTGRIDHLDTPDGSYVYTWLAGNRVSQLTALGNVQLNYTWDGALLTGATTSGPFSASVGYSYDNNFWLTHLNAAGTTVDYGYDTDGLLTSAAVGTTNLSLTLDAQNGLLDATTLGQVNDTWSYARSQNPRRTRPAPTAAPCSAPASRATRLAASPRKPKPCSAPHTPRCTATTPPAA